MTVWDSDGVSGGVAAGIEMLGIEDPLVWLAYLLCILSAILCVVYGGINWDRGDDTVEAADVRWAAREDKVEEDI